VVRTWAMSLFNTATSYSTLINIIQTKLASVFLCCIRHCFVTANIKAVYLHIVSTEGSYITHVYLSVACRKRKS